MKSNLRTGGILALALVVLAALPAEAGIYLQTSPAIPGESTAPGFEDQIEVSSGQWGAGKGISCTQASQPSYSEFTFTTQTSIASVPFIQSMRDNTSYTTFTFRYTKNILGSEYVYQTITFNNVLLSGYSQSSGGDVASESVSINFQSATITYVMLDPNGGKSLGSNTVTINVCS